MKFDIPSADELGRMNEEQLKPLFFELEQNRSKCLSEAADEYVSVIEDIESEYGKCFALLSGALNEARQVPSEIFV